MRLLKQPQQWQVGLILFVGVFAVSTAAILIRLSIASSGVQGIGFSLFIAASRLTIASLLLLPAWRNLQPSLAKPWCFALCSRSRCLSCHPLCHMDNLAFFYLNCRLNYYCYN